MDNYFTQTLANITLAKLPNKKCEDEHPFIADLFNDKIAEVGHIQLIPNQNRIRITATINNEETKSYDIMTPKLEFLKFIFENTNPKVKRAVKFYAHTASDARKQHEDEKRNKLTK